MISPDPFFISRSQFVPAEHIKPIRSPLQCLRGQVRVTLNHRHGHPTASSTACLVGSSSASKRRSTVKGGSRHSTCSARRRPQPVVGDVPDEVRRSVELRLVPALVEMRSGVPGDRILVARAEPLHIKRARMRRAPVQRDRYEINGLWVWRWAAGSAQTLPPTSLRPRSWDCSTASMPLKQRGRRSARWWASYLP